MEEVYDTLLSKEKIRYLAEGSGSRADGLVVSKKNQYRNLSRV